MTLEERNRRIDSGDRVVITTWILLALLILAGYAFI